MTKKRKCANLFFLNIFCISDGRISRIMKFKNTCTTPSINQVGKYVPHNKTIDLKLQAIEDFVNKFPIYELF